MSRPSAFKTPEGEAALLAAYDAALRLWPVPYEEMDIPTQCGMTHVVVSGPKDAPPVVLLHGYVGDIDDVGAQYRGFQQGLSAMPSMTWGSPGLAPCDLSDEPSERSVVLTR
jgi:hypothetical protein